MRGIVTAFEDAKINQGGEWKMPNNDNILKLIILTVLIISIVVTIAVTTIVLVTSDKLESIAVVQITVALLAILGGNGAIALLIKSAVRSEDPCSTDSIHACLKKDPAKQEFIQLALKQIKKLKPDDTPGGGVTEVLDMED